MTNMFAGQGREWVLGFRFDEVITAAREGAGAEPEAIVWAALKSLEDQGRSDESEFASTAFRFLMLELALRREAENA